MSNIIGLTHPDEKRVLVNADQITFIRKHDDLRTEVGMACGTRLYVNEDMFTVLDRIEPSIELDD